MNILQEADKITSGDRRKAYGDANKSLVNLANAWNNYLQTRGIVVEGRSISADDVAMLMIILKVYRNAAKPQRDNLVDIAGYARVAEMANSTVYSLKEQEIKYVGTEHA